MADPFTPHSRRSRWHEHVEHYTPDGPLGRLLFTLVSGSLGVGALVFAVFSLVSFTFGFLAAVIAVLSASVGLVACLLAIVVLWPVYLSLIGNVESAASYAQADATGSSATADDPVEILKREYAAGNVSDEAFERRLDALLDAEERDSRQGGNHHREAARELE